MNKNILLIICAIITFFVNSCEKENVILYEDLIGYYEYYVSDGYFNGELVGKFKKTHADGLEYYDKGLHFICFNEDSTCTIGYNGWIALLGSFSLVSGEKISNSV